MANLLNDIAERLKANYQQDAIKTTLLIGTTLVALPALAASILLTGPVANIAVASLAVSFAVGAGVKGPELTANALDKQMRDELAAGANNPSKSVSLKSLPLKMQEMLKDNTISASAYQVPQGQEIKALTPEVTPTIKDKTKIQSK